MNNRQVNKLKPGYVMDAFQAEAFAEMIVMECAEIPLPASMATEHEIDCFPDGWENADALGRPVGYLERFEDRLLSIPVSELSSAKAHKYICAELGCVTAVVHASKPCVMVSDISRISGITADELHTLIYPDHFTTLKLFGKGDVSYEFITWETAAFFCTDTDAGRLFIAWVYQVVLFHLATGPSRLNAGAISAALLHAMIPVDAKFPEWKAKFLRDHLDTGIEADADPSEDFSIPLPLAKRYTIANPGCFGLLAYIIIREVEAPIVDYNPCSIEEYQLSMYYLCPNDLEQVKARPLHFLLRSKQPFDAWIHDAIESCGLVNGVDYFTEPAPNDQSVPGCDPPASTRGEILLTIAATVKIGETSPTARGELIRDYTRELGLTPPEVPGRPVAAVGTCPG